VSDLDEIRSLLPWYAAGTLDAGETAAVETALAGSEELRAELRELRALQDVVLAPRAAEPSFRPSLIAGAWQRIDAYEREQRPARPVQLQPLAGLRRLWAEFSSPAQWVLAAQFTVILALGGALAISMSRGPAAGSEFSTLAGGATATAGGPRLTVAFQPSATEADLRSLLERLDAQVVAGPTAEQMYTLQLKRGGAAEAEHAAAELRAAPELVRFAVPEHP